MNETVGIKEAAARAGVSEYTIRRLVWRQKLPRLKGLSIVRIPEKAFSAWLKGEEAITNLR